jgi:diguanylate cyclase (GGDEF)-like protein/PAS domain S-box-containing protein
MQKIKALLKSKLSKFPIKISLLYFIISFFWILFSDRLTQLLFTDSKLLLLANMLKGWIYVIVITVFLYGLLNRVLKQVEAAENKLQNNYDELKISEDRLQRAQAIAHVGNWELDITQQMLWASEEAFHIFGLEYVSSIVPFERAQNMIHEKDRQRMDQALSQLILENKEYDEVYSIIRNNDKQERILHSVAKLWYNQDRKPVKVLGVIRDITEEKLAEQSIKQNHEELTALYEELAASDEELKQQYDQIHELAYKDLVTGLPNRLSLQEKVTEMLGASRRMALLFIDLDNFKNINDSFGHFFGDTVLAEMGARLTDALEEGVFVARLGGDEFAIVITREDTLGRLKEFAGRILSSLVTSFQEEDIRIHISASIGIAIYPEHAGSLQELLKSADTAMYEAKKQGKNQYVIFSPSMNQELYAKVAMESNLRAAMENNELMLYYQPIYCLKSNKTHGFEALLRWKSPIYGMVSPAAFIPLAEETGLILQLGKWVLENACAFISRLNASRDEKLTISVNVSVYQLSEDGFVEEVLEILKKNNLDARQLTLEITESILMEDVETNLKKIDTLKKQGIRVALDDFGTGYSSLTYLKRLPISILKLDKAFIDDIVLNKTDNDIVKSIMLLAKTLHLAVIAEGVEEKDQFDCLVKFGCDMLQGYYISKPLPEEEAISLL